MTVAIVEVRRNAGTEPIIFYVANFRLMEGDYKVKLEVFEGPLDLLLYLIKKDEVDIYDVSIERITSQYLEYVETFRMLELEIAGEFVVMAAN